MLIEIVAFSQAKMHKLKFNYLTIALLFIICLKSSLANDLEQQQYDELQHVERHLQRQEYASLLANALSGSGFPALTSVQKTILDNFDLNLIEGIYHDALQEVFYEQPLADISLKLWNVAIQNAENPKAFESVIRSQLTLYSLYNMFQQLDYKYLMQFALILNRFVQEPEYNESYTNLTKVLKIRLEKGIKSIPLTLRNFFFESSFCLVNQKTQQMLYKSQQPIFPQGQELYVLTSPYPNCQLNASSSLEIDIYSNNSNIKDLSIMLKSNPGQWMFIKVEYLPFLTASEKDYTNQTDILWRVDLVSEEALVFKSNINEGYMCLSDVERNVVQVLNGVNAEENELCQWKAIKCDNKC